MTTNKIYRNPCWAIILAIAFLMCACATTPVVNEGWAIREAQRKAWELDGKFTNWEMRGKVPRAILHQPERINEFMRGLDLKLAGKRYWVVTFTSYGPELEHGLVVLIDAESAEILGYYVD